MIFLQKSFKFVLNRRSNIIVFNLNFILLLAKVDLIVKELGHKKDAFITHNSNFINIVFILLEK